MRDGVAGVKRATDEDDDKDDERGDHPEAAAAGHAPDVSAFDTIAREVRR